MRKRTKRELRTMLDQLITPMLDARLRAVLQRIHEADDGAITAIQQIQPARVDMTQELADDIARKIRGPLTIPREMGDWVREEAKYHDMHTYQRIGFSAMAADVQWTLKVDGSITLEIRRVDGYRWWLGRFTPPDAIDGEPDYGQPGGDS